MLKLWGARAAFAEGLILQVMLEQENFLLPVSGNTSGVQLRLQKLGDTINFIGIRLFW